MRRVPARATSRRGRARGVARRSADRQRTASRCARVPRARAAVGSRRPLPSRDVRRRPRPASSARATSYISASTRTRPASPRIRRAPSHARADSSAGRAVGVADQDRAAHAEQRLGGVQRAQHVVAHGRARVADHVGVAEPQARAPASGSMRASMQVTIASRRAGSRRAAAADAAAGRPAPRARPARRPSGSAAAASGRRAPSCRTPYSASCWYAIDWNDIRCSGETPCFSIAARCSGVE